MNIIIVDDRNILLSELLLDSDATIFGVVLTTKVIYHTRTNDTVFHNSNFEKKTVLSFNTSWKSQFVY